MVMGEGVGFDSDSARVAAVRARHEADLMGRANVVAVSEGSRVRGGVDTGQVCLVVYVARKVPRTELAASDVLPAELDGVPVDVRESGPIHAL
ncbi:hypothetical protein [Alloactinosynnema sp. L-07]|nr:hypothetical protein [Alloactinosynnema sp. L-07]